MLAFALEDMASSRCFIDAAALWRTSRERRISDEEYLNIMLAHFKGVRHPYDRIKGDTLHIVDPFADSLRELIFGHEDTPVGDVSQYYMMFLSCLHGKYDAAIASFNEILTDNEKPTPLQPLACLAAMQSNGEVFEFCLNLGAVFDRDLDLSAGRGAINETMLEILYKVNFRDIRNSREPLDSMLINSLYESHHTMEWLLAHGAQPTTAGLRSASRDNVVVSRLAKLVDICGGVLILAGCGAVEEAARVGDLEKLEYLIKGGLDVHLDGRSLALYLGIEEIRADAVEFLLDHGAKVKIEGKRRYETNQWESPLELAKRLRNQPILDLVEKKAQSEPDP